MTVDDIAAAIKDDLLANYDAELPTTVDYVLDEALENVTALKVHIMPRDEESTVENRRSNHVTFTVDVAVIRPAAKSLTSDEIKELQREPRNIRDFLDRRKQAGASWKRNTLATTYSYDHLKKTRLLVSMVRCEYRTLQ
ncbi:hypothetical protein [Gimesia chilikensis]|uniref:hypothetical protein n=1 Tax=Gimesia chilikensis TaxID=2605989 RepID=UPI003A91A18B